MNDCIGILYSDSEFMDLTGTLILAPPGYCSVASLPGEASGTAGQPDDAFTGHQVGTTIVALNSGWKMIAAR